MGDGAKADPLREEVVASEKAQTLKNTFSDLPDRLLALRSMLQIQLAFLSQFLNFTAIVLVLFILHQVRF